jgi:hypothetical protein
MRMQIFGNGKRMEDAVYCVLGEFVVRDQEGRILTIQGIG